MESKEIIISKNAKLKSFKSSPSENNIKPFIVTNTDSTSFLIKNSSKANEKKDEKNDKSNNNNKNEENNMDKIKSFEGFSPFFNNSLDFHRKEHSKKTINRHDQISQSLDKLSKGDDMDILSELMSLCNFLALSSERIGFNPSIPKLIEEICKNLTKTYLPEIIIYSLQCINHILDLNPDLTYVLKKVNAISLIMNTISCFEDITCVDYIIKIFEKISTQNTKILLENKVFESLLVNIFDFLNVHQKKSIMKICHNIIVSKRINTNEYNTYIKPAMNIIINMIRIDNDDNNDNLFISEKAIYILYNIINYFKYSDYNNTKENKEQNIIQELITNYNIVENFMDILNKYFINNNQIITEQLIKYVLKTIVLILEISKEGMEKILSNKFLDIISDIINNEYYSETKVIKNNNSIIKNKRKNSNANGRRGIFFILEFFDILIALFPTWKDDDSKNKKILNSENKIYYDYFCQNILLPLITNITNKSTNKILNNVIKLTLAFINNSNKIDIISFLPSKQISQIIIKLLDTKNKSNILDAISLVISILEKAPEYFIVNFIREGIVHNLKNLKIEQIKSEIKNDDNVNTNDRNNYFEKMSISPLISSIPSANELISRIDPDRQKKIIIKKDEKSDPDKKEKNKFLEMLTIDELDKKEKEKNSEENIIGFKKFIFNENLQKEKSPNLSELMEPFNQENDFKINSEVENEQDEEEEQEEEDIENNGDESQNEEKEENDGDEDLGSFLLSKKKSIFSSYTEDKEKDKNETSEIKIKKEKENAKILEPEINQTQKETKFKKLNLFEEESNNSLNLDKNTDDILMTDLINTKEEKIDINTIQSDIKINTKTKNESSMGEKNKFEEIKKNVNNLIQEPKGISLKKKLNDLLKCKLKYNELENNLENLEIKSIKEKLKDLMTNYLNDQKINQYLSKTENKTKDGLMKIRTTLSNYQKLLSSDKEENKNKEKYIKEIIDILTDENVSITLFELEHSKILLSLSSYIDPEFENQYNKLKDDYEYSSIDKLIDNLSDKNLCQEKNYNFQIYEKIYKLFESFEGDKSKIIKFIKLLNESIQIMNCPIFLLTDSKKYNINKFSFRAIKRHNSIRLKMEYNEQIFKDNVLNENIIIDNNYKTKLCEINMFFRNNKRTILVINNNSTFKNMSVNLLSTSNIPLIVNDKYEICIKFFIKNSKNNIEKMDIEENNDVNKGNKNEDEKTIQVPVTQSSNEQKENELFIIDESWTYKLFLENYTKICNKSIPQYIQFGLSIKTKNENENNNKIKELNNGFIDYYSPFTKDLPNLVEYIILDKYCFIKDYHDNIMNCKSIKFSKRLMPSLYLLSLLNISINKYKELFNLPEAWFINNDKNKIEWKKLFFNPKIEQFLMKISVDPYKVSNTSFPFLGEYIAKNNQSLTKFQTRLLSFKTSSPTSYKSLINLQNHLKHINPNNHSKYSVTLKKTMRLKVRVDRDNILDQGINIINDEIISKFKGYLEFEYIGEIGNGLGPTLEFYTLILDKLKEDKRLWYKTTNGSLYPRLLNCNENKERDLKLFKLLGFIVGRAIFDDRLLDIPLSKVFWNLVLDKPVLFKNIKIIDSYLYNTLLDFVKLINEKKQYIKNNNIQNVENWNFDDTILFNKCKLSSLDIYFTFPGYDDIELKPNGKDILLTMNNIEEYVNLIYDFLFFRGIDKIIKSFKEGFNMNFNIDKLKTFSSSEIEDFICGSLDTKWDQNILFENIRPEHGYTHQSKIFNDLIKFMSNLDKNKRKQFLIFATASSRLPIGGFKSLSPKLTVVKRYCEEGKNPDDYLPTVMTCQNYLKIPEYSSYNIFEQKMLFAISEGCNEFNLS